MLHLCRRMVAAATCNPVLNQKAPGLHPLLPHTLSGSGLAAARLARSRTLAQPSQAHPARLASTSSSTPAAAAMTAAAALAVVPDPAAVKPLPDASTAGAGAAATQSTILQQHVTTKQLRIDTDSLPAAATPDADAVTAYLTAPDAPDLSPDSCPHLYYHLEHSPASSRSSSSDALQEAAQLLRSGQPVAIPTETVYGLAANGLSAAAVAAVYAAKGRPSDNPLILHISDLDMLARLYPQQQQQQQQQQDCNSSSNGNGCSHSSSSSSSSSSLAFLPKQYHRLIAAFWPGPLTLLLPASPLIPAAVTAGLPTVAVRMPAHPVARALIAAAGVPLAAPSANTSGRPSPTTAQHVMQDLAGCVAAVVDGGPCTCGVESTVLDGLRDPAVVLRPGGITPELLELCADMQGLQVYQRDFTDKQLEDTPTTPGMKYRHYSPTAPLLLLDPTAAWRAQQQHEQQQHVHDGLQQLVVDATQQLLDDLWQAQQQQQQLTPHASRQCLVLLSTCGSSTKVGWTEASLQLLQQHMQEHAQLPGGLLDPQPAANGILVPLSSSSSSSSSSRPDVLEYALGSWQQPEVIAQQVFAALRAADSLGPALIIAQGLPPEGAALAIMNRLQKAASQHVQVAAAVPKS